MKVSRLYTRNLFAQININNILTEWFDTNCGVKQGDTLSPSMFGIFINDIVDNIKSVNVGVNINGINVCILLYIDDTQLLKRVYEWSNKMENQV